MVSMASVVVNVALNLALVRVLGYRGLALGTSITALLNATAQLWLLRQRLSGIEGRAIAVSFVRVLLASLVMAVVAWGADLALPQWLPGDTLPLQALRLALVIALSVAPLAGGRRGAAAFPNWRRPSRWCGGGSGGDLESKTRLARARCRASGRWPRRTWSWTPTRTSTRRCCRC